MTSPTCPKCGSGRCVNTPKVGLSAPGNSTVDKLGWAPGMEGTKYAAPGEAVSQQAKLPVPWNRSVLKILQDNHTLELLWVNHLLAALGTTNQGPLIIATAYKKWTGKDVPQPFSWIAQSAMLSEILRKRWPAGPSIMLREYVESTNAAVASFDPQLVYMLEVFPSPELITWVAHETLNPSPELTAQGGFAI